MQAELEKIDFAKLALTLEDGIEHTVSQVEDLKINITTYHGEYPAHKHPKDEFFYVMEGEIELQLDKELIILRRGEGLKVPRETVHRPYARNRAVVMKIEPVDFPFERVTGS